MAHVLALLSKKDFDAASKAQGRKAGPLPLDRFVSRSKSIARLLEGGGDLYLIAIMWHGAPLLVARLRAPRREEGAWVGSPNDLLTRHDTQQRLRELRLPDGSQLPEDPKALAKILQQGVAIDEDTIRALGCEPEPRRATKPAKPAAKLRFSGRRSPRAASELKPWEKRQLRRAGELYDGANHSVAKRLKRDDASESPYFHDLVVYDLVGAKGPELTAWFYNGDSGCLFVHGKTEVVAEVVQGGLECEDGALRAALLAARQKVRAKGSGITYR